MLALGEGPGGPHFADSSSSWESVPRVETGGRPGVGQGWGRQVQFGGLGNIWLDKSISVRHVD